MAEKVDYVVKVPQLQKAGELTWNGAIYEELVENHPESVTIIDEDGEHHPDEWRDVEAPAAVVEELEYPKLNLVRPFRGNSVVSRDDKTGNIVYNHDYEMLVPGKPNRRTAVTDSFRMQERGLIKWERAIIDLDNLDREAYTKTERVIYDDKAHKFRDVSEELASKIITKDRPMTEMTIHYDQGRAEYSRDMDLLTETNYALVEDLLTDFA